ncbi:MAG: hypothetical protein ACO2PN_24340 [Pyrobaculum sp.]
MKSQKVKRSATRRDVEELADAIAREIVHWCYHHSGDPVNECLIHHMEFTDSYDMYVPKEYEQLYRRIIRSRRKTAALDRAIRARLNKALRQLEKYWKRIGV